MGNLMTAGPRWPAALAATAIICGGVAGLANAASPESYVQVATGRVAGDMWTLGIARQGRRRCFSLDLLGNGSTVTSSCESAAKPPEIWQRRTGLADESASIELDLTQPRVRRLKLLLGHPGGQPERRPSWTTVFPQLITSTEAADAHLSRDFRFAVLSGSGANLCVEKVRAFDGRGRLIESISVPCEY